MKKLVFRGIAVVGLVMATGAQAESWTMDVSFTPANWIGGVGPDNEWGRAGTSEITVNGQLEGQAFESRGTCAFMDQPPNALFDFHMTCQDQATDGNASHVLFGCNAIQGREREYSCVGGIQGTAGQIQGRQGSVTMHLHSISESGASGTGVGQWFE
ncbi:MAG: hypothetical protein ABR601_07425 [Parasphingopyxis sp.]|nr:hypothetical protein [Sphingomonadales bacterium]